MRRLWGGRRLVVGGVIVLFLLCLVPLGPRVVSLSEGADPFGTIGRFFGAALTPALTDESPNLPEGATPFLSRVGADLVRTVRYALVAMSLAVPAGLLLGFLASRAWWPGGMEISQGRWGFRLLRGGLHGVRWFCRFFITLLRSVHELIWAMLILSAVGDAPVTACIALALPFAGTLGKVFSELIDEQGQGARVALTAGGASPLQAFFGALLPQAVPDFLTYTLYRFECALRSSAVLGFIGVETLGLGIRRSFENLYFQEVWTQLYVLIAVIVVVDLLGARMRARMHGGVARSKKASAWTEEALRRSAPRDWLVRTTVLAMLGLVLLSWCRGPGLTEGTFGVNAHDRMARFVTKITPLPARPSHRLASWEERSEAWGESDGAVGEWAWALWLKPGREALTNTLAIATAAIALAGVGAALLLPLASRALATPEPFGVLGGASRGRRLLLRVGGVGVRSFFVVSRAVPEYILAFLFVAMLGPSAWPLVLALALHNIGILGRLWGEVMENERPEAARQLTKIGATRGQVYLGSLVSQSFNRFLLFFFYRWETCVREATILGMLGISSLGYYISLARGAFRYDRMLFFVLLGALVIFAGDLLSDWLRRKYRVVR
jgi:phosphonate transport system permease protein